MLDQSTKRKIDSARNILVGKVPDPKAQVEQITTALIYKFMDDMDKESEELGGEVQFFSNGFEKYSWTKLMDKRLSGQERLDRYVEAITSMSKNPHIPQLFRDIFKDAFLPYRDYETLSLFLKEINEFNYDHSENLGNAFEYLLSVLGSQGDAGQFRTPRHIIDFIVEIVDPKKSEKVLDPACGTAGFLISSYKHILKHNSSAFKLDKEKTEEIIEEGETASETILVEKDNFNGDKLSPEEKAKVMANIAGYDISPDMVKLSLVNLYLHGFSNPKIFEYDTLSSEKRWEETSDVIMANPPFMTPKGGIRPHKRFQVQANRSEVLFVDYILEHLNQKGRAGIIVPEGIIFQSNNAYKHLRRLLIEDGLFAVVSLPPGVFNPYSGVKTSILFFDNELAKSTDELLFVKVENDGFDLGAQRRKIKKNDLPRALEILEGWKKEQKLSDALHIAHAVNKSKVIDSGDFNLTGDRYKETAILVNQKWPMVELGDGEYFTIESGGTPDSKNEAFWNGDVAWVTLVDIPQENRITEIRDTRRKITEDGLKKSSAKLLPVNSVLVSSRATIGRIGISKIPLATNQGFKNILIKDVKKVSPTYLANILTLKVEEMNRLGTGGTYKEISKSTFSKIKIPLPPPDVQTEIVEQITSKHEAIEHAKAVIANLESESRFFGKALRKQDVELVELQSVCKQITDGTHRTPKYTASGIPFLRVTDITSSKGSKKYISEVEHQELIKRCKPQRGDILYSKNGTIGVAKVIDWNWEFSTFVSLALLKPDKKKINGKYLELILNANEALEQARIHSKSGTVTNLHLVEIKKMEIPLPSIVVQEQLIEEVKKEEEIIEGNRRLIEIMESKISGILSEI